MRCWLVLAVLLAWSGDAFGQRAEAAAAFRRGRELMAKGDTAAACREFETSMKLDPENGTLYNLAVCHEALGKLASAWTELRELAETDSNAGRRKEAARRAAALEPRLTRMRLVLAKPAPQAVVTRNDVDVTPLVGQTTVVDPGRYTFVAKAPGREPATIEVALDREGETIVVEIPALAEVAGGHTELPEAPAGDAAYPMQLPLRPLVLPRGTSEVTATGALIDNDNRAALGIASALRGRMALRWLEAEVAIGAHLKYAEPPGERPDVLHFIAVAGRYPITPLFTVSLEYTRFQPTGGLGAGSDVRTLVSRKQLIAPVIAIDGRAGVLFSQRSDSATSELTLTSEGRLQLAPLAWLSFEVFAGLDLNLGGELRQNTAALAVAASGLVAVTPQLDAFVTGGSTLLPSAPRESVVVVGTAWRTR
jgi:hypothetical protein